MKAAIVLYADALSLMHQAGEINLCLAETGNRLDTVVLWLFYSDKEPAVVPEIKAPIAGILFCRVENPHLPESFLSLLEQIYQRTPVDLMLFSSSGLGAELATRSAYRFKGSSCLQAGGCQITPDGLEVSKPAYASHLTAKFLLKLTPYCLSVARHPCGPALSVEYDPGRVEHTTLPQLPNTWSTQASITWDKTDTGLANADRVLVVGQGIKNKKNMAEIQDIAGTLDAALGASRPVVMNGWTEMNRLIGASGAMVSPRLCIAAGVSGAGAFNVGIKSSEKIVAINTDPGALIFQLAHVGIVDDLFAVLGELRTLRLARQEKTAPGTDAACKEDPASVPDRGETP